MISILLSFTLCLVCVCVCVSDIQPLGSYFSEELQAIRYLISLLLVFHLAVSIYWNAFTHTHNLDKNTGHEAMH